MARKNADFRQYADDELRSNQERVKKKKKIISIKSGKKVEFTKKKIKERELCTALMYTW